MFMAAYHQGLDPMILTMLACHDKQKSLYSVTGLSICLYSLVPELAGNVSLISVPLKACRQAKPSSKLWHANSSAAIVVTLSTKFRRAHYVPSHIHLNHQKHPWTKTRFVGQLGRPVLNTIKELQRFLSLKHVS